MERGRGVRGLLLNVGGDLRVGRRDRRGRSASSAPWADSESSEPIALIEVKDRAVATSGSSQRGFQIDGRWYSHIFDPRSGLPAEGVVEATVIAAAIGRRRRAGDDLQRPLARGRPAAGRVAARTPNA